MKLPKHIHPEDDSPKAYSERVDHCIEMSMLNPSGFRQPTSKKGSTKKRLLPVNQSLISIRAYQAGMID